MRVLFWNTNRKENNLLICDLIRERQINIVVLAEYNDDIDSLAINSAMNKYQSIGCDKLTILGNYNDVEMGAQADRYSFQIIKSKYILCSLHLPSRMSDGHQERRNIVIDTILHDLKVHEDDLKSKCSIIIGDFNEDPYGDGCLAANHFLGLPYKSTSQHRIIEGQKFEKFYNPMWNMFGDFNSPPGTYYYNESNPMGTYWHLFDQVLIRPNLRNCFVDKSLEIVTKTGEHSLLDTRGHPNKIHSDHLPIIFELQEE